MNLSFSPTRSFWSPWCNYSRFFLGQLHRLPSKCQAQASLINAGNFGGAMGGVMKTNMVAEAMAIILILKKVTSRAGIF
jgi:hypothetical protein